MDQGLFITLSTIMKEISFEIVFMPQNPKDVKIYSRDVSRLGLALIGPIDHFDRKRILLMGESENYFLSTLSSKEIYRSMKSIVSLKPPVIIVTSGIKPADEVLEVAKECEVPILLTKDSGAELMALLNPILNMHLAPRITRSGGLLNIHGEGVLLVGESGVGKSEVAIELLKRGHKLIADDLVELRKIPKSTLVGCSPKNIRHFLEVRGIGIINARRIFGIGAVKVSETIDMVINLEIWKDEKNYDRMGADSTYTEILGVKVPYLNIPVRPGRNLAAIIEVAAMNNRQRKLGFNAAQELFSSLGMKAPEQNSEEIEKCLWDI